MNDIPVSTIKEQSLTDIPTTGDATLVNDSSVLVDGAGLVGGPNTLVEGIQSSIATPKLYTKIPRSS